MKRCRFSLLAVALAEYKISISPRLSNCRHSETQGNPNLFPKLPSIASYTCFNRCWFCLPCVFGLLLLSPLFSLLKPPLFLPQMLTNEVRTMTRPYSYRELMGFLRTFWCTRCWVCCYKCREERFRGTCKKSKRRFLRLAGQACGRRCGGSSWASWKVSWASHIKIVAKLDEMCRDAGTIVQETTSEKL